MPRLHLLLAALFSPSYAFLVAPKPNLVKAAQPAVSSKLTAAIATAPLFASLPAFAYEDAADLDGLNGILTVAVGFFVVFIGGFAFSAAAEVGSQVEERADRLGFNQKGGGARRPQIVYEDVDYTYKDLSKPVENSRTRKKQSKQVKADGKRFAPWMIIDEEMVEKNRAKRVENKRKTGKFFG